MDDLISRSDAVNAIYHHLTGRTIDECRMMLHEVPSERRTGEWIQKPNVYGVAYCSECDYELHTNDTNYCPNCGAKMRGELE